MHEPLKNSNVLVTKLCIENCGVTPFTDSIEILPQKPKESKNNCLREFELSQIAGR